jgi:hypothetical protein
MEKHYFVKIPAEGGFSHYIKLNTATAPEVLELTQNEANKRSYEERVAATPNISIEAKQSLRTIFPHTNDD